MIYIRSFMKSLLKCGLITFIVLGPFVTSLIEPNMAYAGAAIAIAAPGSTPGSNVNRLRTNRQQLDF